MKKVDLIKKDQLEILINNKEKAIHYFSNLENSLTNSNFGIAGNTFRSFRSFEYPPSIVYKEWINKNNIFKIYLPLLNRINSYESFLEIHKSISNNLDMFWTEKQKKKLSVSQKYKIIDLLLKFLAKVKYQRFNNINKNIVKFAHIPLDKYSLIAIKKFFFGIVISSKPSMGDIKDEETYFFIQNQIRNLTKLVKIPNLYFDYYAWDLKVE